MERVPRIMEIIRKGKRMLQWLKEIPYDHKMKFPKGSDVLEWAETIRCFILGAHPRKNLLEVSGFAYLLQSLFNLCGKIGSVIYPKWLCSDCIQVSLYRIHEFFKTDSEEELRHRVFLLPPYEWAGITDDAVAERHSRQIMDLLEKEKHPIVECEAQNLRKPIIYAVVNVNGSHWCSVEVDVATKRILVYDPAKKGGSEAACDVQYAQRLVQFLKLLGESKATSTLKPPWRYQQALGGQQNLAFDQFNCGVISTEWILFRIYSDVRKRELRCASHWRDLLSETPMASRSGHEWDLKRLSILLYAAQTIEGKKPILWQF